MVEKKEKPPSSSRKRSARVIYEADQSVEWYTPARIRALALRVLGAIHFDPATPPWNPLGAVIFCTELDGPPSVEKWWALLVGMLPLSNVRTLFINPPYGRETGDWLELLAQLHERAEREGMDLRSLAFIPARPGATWYRREKRRADIVCELDGRITFEVAHADGTIGPYKDPARWGCALLYRGCNRRSIAALLRPYGDTRTNRRARREGPKLATPKATDTRQQKLTFEREPSATDAIPRWPSNVLPLQPRRIKGAEKP